VKPIPKWLKIALPVLIMGGILVAALVALVMETVPPDAQPAVLEARFEKQLAFMRDLAGDLPMQGCEERPGARSREELLALVDSLKAWETRVKAGEDLFKDPVILAAEILQMCDGSQKTYGVKRYEGPESTWSAAMFRRTDQWPSVSLWFAGTQRQVRYDARIGGSDADPLLIRLILDLENL